MIPTLATAVQQIITGGQRKDSIAARLLFMMKIRERWWDRLRLAASVVFVPNLNDWTALQLPPGLFGIYYPLRLLRLFYKYTFARILVALRAPIRSLSDGPRRVICGDIEPARLVSKARTHPALLTSCSTQ